MFKVSVGRRNSYGRSEIRPLDGKTEDSIDSRPKDDNQRGTH